MDLDEDGYRRWYETATSSLRMAGIARNAGEYHHACLHAEEAAQQAAKGLLHGVGKGPVARGHDLVALGEDAAVSAGAQIEDEVDDALVRLARATTFRPATRTCCPGARRRTATADRTPTRR